MSAFVVVTDWRGLIDSAGIYSPLTTRIELMRGGDMWGHQNLCTKFTQNDWRDFAQRLRKEPAGILGRFDWQRDG